ncbi:MAG: hypothetical protein BAJALOKI2v1_530010 [Promethearchaeota archaeon]|nr:MAG: hypothetical protein BAJALOKI2v1_530010 [Candidatus Lokiarchaeota archaeon]
MNLENQFSNEEEVQRKIIQREFYIDNQLYLKFEKEMKMDLLQKL